MEITANDIAKLVNGKLTGNGQSVLRGAAGLEEAGAQDVSFLRDVKKKDLLSATKAGAVLVPKGFTNGSVTTIEVDNPIAAFAQLLKKIYEEKNPTRHGVSSLAAVSKSAKIGKNVFIGPFCIVEDEAVIQDGAVLQGHVYVGRKASVGENTLLYPHVVLREEVKVGARCIIHAGTVLGSDGYGFYFADGRHNKIPQVGTVILEDDVEIGANCAIDRATLGATLIRRGAKFDNLVHIAHNVEVGPHSLIMGQVGVAGSTKLGAGVVLAGQVGIADHVNVGDGVQVGAQSGIKNDVPPKTILFGSPAQPIQDTMKQILLIRRLPELFNDMKKLLKGTTDNGGHKPKNS